MSAMLHLAHGAVRMGQLGRKLQTGLTIDIRTLGPGQHIIHGRLGDNIAGIAPSPVLTESPIELYSRWSPSTGYTMLIDVDQYVAEGAYFSGGNIATAVPGGYLKRIEVTLMLHTIPGDSRYWGGNSATQLANYSKSGLYKWESFQQIAPGSNGVNSNGEVAKRWTHWTGLTPNVAHARSLAAQVQANQYVIDLSISSNWQIDNFNPTNLIHIENARQAGGGTYSQIPNFDGIATITLNSIDSTGVPTFTSGESIGVNGVPGDSTAPTWINEYTASSGKKGRIILDYSGRLITAMGIDLPGDVKTW